MSPQATVVQPGGIASAEVLLARILANPIFSPGLILAARLAGSRVRRRPRTACSVFELTKGGEASSILARLARAIGPDRLTSTRSPQDELLGSPEAYWVALDYLESLIPRCRHPGICWSA